MGAESTPGGFSPGALEAYIDGSSRGNPGPGAGAAVIFDGRKIVARKGKYLERCTNNQAEYTALLLALETALLMGCTSLTVKTDSQLVARQIGGSYKVKNRNILPLYLEAVKLIGRFREFAVVEIPREENTLADRLTALVIARHRHGKPASGGASAAAD
ncbi:MAG: ribonuclease HI family protein [bacterium]